MNSMQFSQNGSNKSRTEVAYLLGEMKELAAKVAVIIPEGEPLRVRFGKHEERAVEALVTRIAEICKELLPKEGQ